MRRAEARPTLRLALLLTGLVLATLALSACTQSAKRRPSEAQLRLFRVQLVYTNDEHGWIEGLESGHGAAALVGQLEGHAGTADAQVWLSGGDNWTGPAISTWFEGRSTVEVMNAMGYRAAAVGNHEFDFGLAALRERTAEAGFPYLAANMRSRTTGRVPVGLGIRSHVVLQVHGFPIGVIGLITTTTPRVTNPANVADFEFLPYEAPLREAAAAARAEGAKALIVLAHVCVGELRALAEDVEDLGIAFFGAGHCNESHAERVAGAVLVSTAGSFSEVAIADLRFDRRSGRLLEASVSLLANKGHRPADGPAAIVERWRRRTEEQLGTVLAEFEQPLERRSGELEQLIVNSWLESIPSGEVALLNRGGVRAGLPSGAVTIADVVTVLPFQNTIIEARVPGSVLAAAIARHRPIVGGLTLGDSGWVMRSTGEPLDPDRRYRVLANSFCFAGGDGWTFLADSDPDAYDTSIHFRQPVIDALGAR